MPGKNKIVASLFAAIGLVAALFVVVSHQQAIADFVLAKLGVKAALTGVTLNNGNGNVVTGSDITSQTTALSPDVGAYRWTVNGSNFMALNMPFNTGASQIDFSGNSNTGTVNGATFASSGKVGPALTFDGVDDIVTIADSASIDLSGAFTISVWLNTNNASSFQYAYAKWFADHTAGGYIMGVNANAAFIQKSNGSSWDTIFSPATLVSDTWYHVVATWDGTTNAGGYKIYLNGTVVTSADATQGTILTNNHPLALGRYNFSNLNPWNGEIDEAQIYQRVLSAAQISQMYIDGRGSIPYGTSTDGLGGPTIIQSEETVVGQLWDLSITPISTSGTIGSAMASTNPVLIISSPPTITGSLDNADEGSPILSTLSIPSGSSAGYTWVADNSYVMALNMPFNSGTSQIDVSGNGNTGTNTNSPTFTTSTCKVGGCYSFDGSDDMITLGTPTSLQIGSFSLEAWIKRANTSAEHGIIASAAGGWGIGVNNSGDQKIYLTKIGVSNVKSTGTIDANWHHVVVTYDGTNARFYIDGSLDSTVAYAPGFTLATAKAIGRRPDAAGNVFNGIIDEVRVYNRVLTQMQVYQEYVDGLAGIGGPTRIVQSEHALGQTWDLLATEYLSDGTTGVTNYIDSATVTVTAATTLGITTPSGSQSTNITINYSCSNGTSALRDLLVEYSVNSGSSFSNATLVSTSSGSLVGSILSMVACNSGTSNNSFVWNSLANGVGDIANAQIRITAQYPGGPSATTTNFTVDNPTNLCTAGGEASGGLTAAETSFDNTDVLISGCTLSIDGTHAFTSVTVGNGIGSADSTLTQSDTTTVTVFRTVLNVSGAVTIHSDGLINTDEKGFTPGYISNGSGGATTTGGAGDRSGGSHGGRGGTDSVGDESPQPFDSITAPFDPGSGGGPQSGSGDGGGVIIITASDFTNNGIISANGKRSTVASTGSGAGGTVRIAATGLVSGSGTIRANGGSASTGGGAGAGGRIALIYNGSLTGNDSLEFTMQAFGASEDGGVVDRRGGAGTIYLERTNIHTSGQGDVIIDNNNVQLTATRLTPIGTGLTLADVTVKQRAIAQAATLNVVNLVLNTNATLFHDFTTTSTVYRLNITATESVQIDATSTISVVGRGFVNGYTTNGSGGTTNVGGVGDRTGGSHGGRGGSDNSTDDSIAPFDSIPQPADPGSGGGATGGGGSGGGYVKIITDDLVINGSINTNGATGVNSGGAGGGIWIIATGQISGTGTISANGAAGADATDGSGAGGRIALHYDSAVVGNASLTPVFQAFGATNAGSTDFRGGAGTVYFEKTNIHSPNQGDVVIANNNIDLSVARITTIPTTPSFASITIKDRAIALASTFTVGDLTLQNVGRLQHDITTASTVYRLFITATGTVTVDATSTINVDGRGFVADRTSDGAGGTTLTGASTDREGGSHGGKGGSDSVTDSSGVIYDSITQPADPGGGPGASEGAGGGYVKLTTTNLIINGTITANGTTGANGSGAGGGIWIVASGQVSGTGTVRANGVTANSDDGSGAGGRIALHYNSAVSGNNPLTPTFQAFGGDNAGSTDFRGGAGTVYFEKTNIHGVDQGDVVIANNSVTISVNRITTIPTTPAFASITIKDRAVGQASTFSIGDLTLQNNAVLQHDFTTTATIYKLDITSTGMVLIDATSSINVDGRGFTTGRTSDGAGGITTTGASTDRSGGSHGGRGGSDSVGDESGVMYDNFLAPTDPGGGAGAGGSGGGYLKISGVAFSHAGTITANGVASTNRGGAGGGVWLTFTGQVSGSGVIRANGANSASTTEGPGGGGRIAFYYDTAVSGTTVSNFSIQTYGGSNSGAPTDRVGGAGTIYLKDSAQSYGDLIVDNNSLVTNAARATRLFVSVPAGLPTTVTVRNLSVVSQARLLIDTPCSGTPALNVTGTTNLSNGGTITNNQSGTCTLQQSAISITTTSLPGGLVSVPYSQTIQSSGGYGPHTFVCRSGGVTVACTTVLPAGLDMSSAGVVSGTPTTTGTTLFTVRATEAAPGVGTDDETISLSVGNAPLAPTNLFSNSTDAQLCCSAPSGIDSSPVFSAIYNDVDLAEQALKYRIQVASDVGFTTLLWDSGASGTALSVSCAQGSRCANITYAGSALSMSGVTYYWRIKFWDELDIEGVFSATAQFTTSAAPTAPTSLFSNDSNAQTGLTNPVGILAAKPVFSAVFNDPDLSDTATKYRIQVDNNSNFSSVLWDSGSGGTNMASCNQGTRCANIVFGGADIDRDESTYYWRIKFWDAAGVEGAWSQDPTSTNTFTMGLLGSSTPPSTPPPQPVPPETPIAGAVEVLSSSSLRFNWIDVSNNENGFRLLNTDGNVVADVASGVTQATVTGLPSNTVISGYGVLAYNSVGQSVVDYFDDAVTAAPAVRPVVQQRGGDSVTFIIEPAFTPAPGETSGFTGQTAVQFEVVVTAPDGTVRNISSGFVQSNTYTFQGIAPEDDVSVRVITRNQNGLQNTPNTYEDVAQLSRRFTVNLGVFKKGTNTLPRPLNAFDEIAVRMVLTSVGTDPASSVTINMPLPRYIVYRPGTLAVDGRASSDAADQLGTVANQNGVSATWATVNPGESHAVSFDLAFDVAALGLLRETSAVSAESLVADAVAAVVQSAANPLINLQASVSFAESDAVYMSPVITLEPDVETTVEEAPVEEPVVEETPEAPAEEQPVTIPTPEETAIIEQILQQEFGQPTPAPQPSQPGVEPTPSPAPTLERGETITSSDGGSFNIDVSGGENTLGLTGSAEVSADAIRFTGTTTQPFTVITLIFNNSITAIVVSDSNGYWQTFVDADRLGIAPGQEARVTIEAIAAKGDLRSERVQVGDVTVSRGRSGDIVAEFDTTVSESPIISTLEEIQHQVVRVIEKQEPVIKTTLTVSAPVVIVSSAPLWGYLPYVPTLIYHLITQLVGLVGRKKRVAARFYGVAYDSISKQPLALAIIRIYKTEAVLENAASVGAAAATNKKLVTTIVTDKQGRYDALLEPGQYTLEVAKPGYLFPSQIVTTAIDADFQHVYDTNQGITVQGDQISIPDVPLDPVNSQRQWQLATGGKKAWLAVQRVGDHLAAPILIVGSIVSALVVVTTPDKPSNWIIAGTYIALLALQLRFKPKLEKAWGVVYDIATNAVLPLTTIQLIEPASSKVVTSRLSDYQGRFAFLPEPGKYVIKATRQGYQQVEVVETPSAERQPLKAEISIEKSDQRVTGDIAMRQQG